MNADDDRLFREMFGAAQADRTARPKLDLSERELVEIDLAYLAEQEHGANATGGPLLSADERYLAARRERDRQDRATSAGAHLGVAADADKLVNLGLPTLRITPSNEVLIDGEFAKVMAAYQGKAARSEPTPNAGPRPRHSDDLSESDLDRLYADTFKEQNS